MIHGRDASTLFPVPAPLARTLVALATLAFAPLALASWLLGSSLLALTFIVLALLVLTPLALVPVALVLLARSPLPWAPRALLALALLALALLAGACTAPPASGARPRIPERRLEAASRAPTPRPVEMSRDASKELSSARAPVSGSTVAKPPGTAAKPSGAAPDSSLSVPRAAPSETPGVRAPPVEPASPDEPAPVRSAEEIAEDVERCLERLRAAPEEAAGAFRELWSVEASWIPALIREVKNPAPSGLSELQILIPDREHFERGNLGVDAKGDGVVYDVPGMGVVEYDDIAFGPTKSGKSLKVVIRNFRGKRFTVGVVLRAALLNRFRSNDYPGGDHRLDPVGWWQSFYERVRARL